MNCVKDINTLRKTEPIFTKEAALSVILEQITDGFFVVDSQWVILFANEPAALIAKKPLREVIGKNLWSVVPQYVDSEIYDHYEHAMTSGKPTSFITYLDEFKVWLETRLFPTSQGLTSYFRDITAQKKAESKQTEMFNQLKLTTQELERSNRDLAEFAAVASHDLKEPLKSISFWLDIAGQTSSTDEVRSKCFMRAIQNAKHCVNLIDGMLEYSRVGREQLHFQSISFDKIIASVKSDLANSIAEAGVTMIYSCSPIICVDEIQFVRLFQNLISNAIKFRSPARDLKIEIEIQEVEEKIEFIVKDNGIGIPESDLSTIFQLFSRSENAKSVPGSGIGLATVKKLVELHGGTISAESRVGDGSLFNFSIPKRREGNSFSLL
ncbi:MAG: domain S-box [Bacteriovoracaceae bacterium]|nr:domain S-box [Bacteriovoracaceae bacterium]